MSIEFLIIYSVTVLIASITPGPSMILALNHGIKYGVRSTLASALGNVTATLIQALLSIAGLGAILIESENVFNAIKYLGAIYLVYIGIRTFFSTGDYSLQLNDRGKAHGSFKKLFAEAFLVTAGNPKAIVFFTALFPQFINTQNNTLFQFVVILSILLVIAFGCMMIYGAFGQQVIGLFKNNKKIFDRIVGGTFIGMGISLATGKLKN